MKWRSPVSVLPEGSEGVERLIVPENSGWIEWGGHGPDLVFAHANGFPIGSYRPFLDHLVGRGRVNGWEARPLMPGSDPQAVSSWRPLSVDLVEAIRIRFDGPVVVVGHSLGGVLSLMAAADKPELFRALVLLDPVVFSGVRSVAWGLAKRFGRTHRMPLLAGALRRREVWPDRETARRSWRGKPAFSDWDPAAFDAYLQEGLEEDKESSNVHLRYPKAWEARIFEISPHNLWKEISRLEVPILILRGEQSDTLTPGAAARFVRKAPDVECQVVPGTGHMLPMQDPARVAGIIEDWLEKRLS